MLSYVSWCNQSVYWEQQAIQWPFVLGIMDTQTNGFLVQWAIGVFGIMRCWQWRGTLQLFHKFTNLNELKEFSNRHYIWPQP